jgi:hypothetical protein
MGLTLMNVPKPPPPPGGHNSSSGPVATGVNQSRRNSNGGQLGPPLPPIVVCGLILISQIFGLFVSRSEEYSHLVFALIGMFGSVISLSWFRHGLNNNRSSGRFGDWSGPIQSTGLIWIFVILSWLAGVVNLFFAVYELVRPR